MTGRRETLSRLSSPSRKPGPPLPLGPPQADLSAPGNPAATPAHPRCRFAQTPLAEQDRARAASRRGIDRERMMRREAEITLDTKAERQPDRFEFGQREAAELGASEAKVGKAEQYAVLVHLGRRSEEHTSELQSLMRMSYAVVCLQKKN